LGKNQNLASPKAFDLLQLWVPVNPAGPHLRFNDIRTTKTCLSLKVYFDLKGSDRFRRRLGPVEN